MKTLTDRTTPMSHLDGEQAASLMAFVGGSPSFETVNRGMHNLRTLTRALPRTAAEHEKAGEEFEAIAQAASGFFDLDKRVQELVREKVSTRRQLDEGEKKRYYLRSLLEGRTEHDEDSREKAVLNVLSEILGFDFERASDTGEKALEERRAREREEKKAMKTTGNKGLVGAGTGGGSRDPEPAQAAEPARH